MGQDALFKKMFKGPYYVTFNTTSGILRLRWDCGQSALI